MESIPYSSDLFNRNWEFLIVKFPFCWLLIAPQRSAEFFSKTTSSKFIFPSLTIDPPSIAEFLVNEESLICTDFQLSIAPAFSALLPLKAERLIINSEALTIAPPDIAELFMNDASSISIWPSLEMAPPYLERLSMNFTLLILNLASSKLFMAPPSPSILAFFKTAFLIKIFFAQTSKILAALAPSIECLFASITRLSTSSFIPSAYSFSSLKTKSESKTIFLTPLWINSSRFLKLLTSDIENTPK